MYTLAASKGAVRAGVRRALQRGALADRLRAMSEPVFTLQHTDGAARAGLLRTVNSIEQITAYDDYNLYRCLLYTSDAADEL